MSSLQLQYDIAGNASSVAILVFLKPNLVYFSIVWFIFLRFGS